MCVQLNNTPQVKTGTFINVKQKIFLCVDDEMRLTEMESIGLLFL
jgi:hypothetical protein